MGRISYSQFSKWVECPYAWKLDYVDKQRTFKGNIYTIFGSAMHECLQLYLRVMYAENIKKANELPLDDFLMDEMKKNYLETKENFDEDEKLSSAEELKELDRKIVLNSVILKWDIIKKEFKERVKF